MKYLKIIAKNVLVLIFCYVLLLAEVNSVVSPFFIAFIFAIAVVDDNIFDYIFGAIAKILFDPSLAGALSCLNIVGALVLFWILVGRKSKKSKLGLSFLFLIFASIVTFLYSANSAQNLILGIINIILESAFLYAYVVFFRAIKTRGTATKLAMDEVLGLSLLVAPITLAFSKITILSVTLASFFVPTAILVTIQIFGGVEALAVAVIAGLGVSFCDFNLVYVAVYSLLAIGATTVKRLGRAISVAIMILIDLVMGYFFRVYDSYSLFNLFPLAFVGLVYAVLPKKVFVKLKLLFYDKHEEVCLNEVVVQEERVLKERLKRVSGLFQEMHGIYKQMIIGKLDKGQVEEMIKTELVRTNCVNCPKYKICNEGRGVGPRCISELVKKGLGKKSVSLVDIPTLLASMCGKTNQMIFELNNRLEEYFAFESELAEEDEGKILISNQLLGVSELLDEFCSGFSFGERADEKQESSLIESFLYNDIIVKECAIFYENKLFKRAVLVVKNVGYRKTDFLAVTNLFFKLKTKIVDTRYTRISGWQIITIAPASKYTYLSGVAKTAKDGISGDTFSELRIDETRALFAISDGKGSGSHAEKISVMTMNLIENFYKAGFRTEHIMDNVNKVMSYKSGENFSAVDVCVLDLDSARADFVKRGGTPTIIKKARHAVVIEGSDLPVGMMGNSKSRLENYYLNSGDVVVLASDGVFDAFNTSENFAGFINNLPAVNMQEFVNNILNRALMLYHGKPKDDMTVVAVKLILNR